MKNLKKIVLIFFISLSFLSLMSCGVTDNDDENGDADTSAIAGKWSNENFTITFSGSSGMFYEVNSGSVWSTAMEEGFIEIGDEKFRNISHQSDNQWSLQELWFKPEGNLPADIRWSSTGTIELSGNGQSLTINTTNPFPPGNTPPPYTLFRVD